jgi:hypothetical protein
LIRWNAHKNAKMKPACAVLYRTVHFDFRYGVDENLMNKISFSISSAIILMAIVLAGCAQPAPTPTAAILPNMTPTSSVPLVILLAPPDSNPVVATAAAEVASTYATSNGMQFEQRSLLNSSELTQSLSKLIVLAPDPGAGALASAAPEAQVIAIGFSPESSPANLINIPLGGIDSAQTAFIAGYIAAISAEDWRTGFLHTASSAQYVNDFVAGAEYFCGSCVPFSPPLNEYPLSAQAADSQSWQSAADQLLAQSVNVVYLSPDLEASGAAQYLAGFGVLHIGSGTPPPELTDSWIVSIGSDSVATLRQVLPLALNGQPFDFSASLTFMNANPDLFGESRQASVQVVFADLTAGYIQLPTD